MFLMIIINALKEIFSIPSIDSIFQLNILQLYRLSICQSINYQLDCPFHHKELMLGLYHAHILLLNLGI